MYIADLNTVPGYNNYSYGGMGVKRQGEDDYEIFIEGHSYASRNYGRVNIVELTDEAYEEAKKEASEISLDYNLVYKDALDILKKKSPFEYRMLQKIYVYQTPNVPTACSYFDEFVNKFIIEYNFEFIKEFSRLTYFTSSRYYRSQSPEVDITTAMALIIEHELQHIIRSHVKNIDPKHHELNNICQDLMINNDLKDIYYVDFGLGVNSWLPLKGKFKKKVSMSTVWKVFRDHDIFTHNFNAAKINFDKGDEVEFVIVSNKTKDEDELVKAILEVEEKYFEKLESTGECMCMGYQGEQGKNGQSMSSSSQGGATEDSKKAMTGLVESALAPEDSMDNVKGCSSGVSDALCKLDRRYSSRDTNVSDWKRELKKYMTKGLNSKEVYLVNSPNARVEGQLGRDEDRPNIKTIGLAIDVSGSMGIKDYEYCLDQIESIAKAVNTKGLKLNVVWWGSAKVVEKFNSFEAFKKRCKSHVPQLGGTNPEIAIEEFNKQKNDIQIVLTDGEFWSTSFEPKRLTIWCVTPSGTTRTIEQLNKSKNKCVKFKE